MSLSRLRTLLAHCQERLHSLGLDVIPVGELGVLLIQFQEPDREEPKERRSMSMQPLVFPTLEPLLPPGSTLVGNEQARLLSLLVRLPSEEEQQGRLLAQEQLTRTEWHILMAIIDAFPGYASYAHLLAVLTSSSVQACQQRLQAAHAGGSEAVKHTLRPLRKVLTSLHPKLEHIGLRAVSVQARGYVLVACAEQESASGEQVP